MGQGDLLALLEPASTSLPRETLAPLLATLLLEALDGDDTVTERGREANDEQDRG